MKYRKLGEATVSEIGFGTWGIGGITEGTTSYGPVNDSASILAIRAALDQGINFFDTANLYGDGHSEELIGEVIHQDKCRDQMVIATKGGLTKFYGHIDLSRENLENSLKDSLKRLNTDYVDFYQLYNAPIEMIDAEVLSILEKFKKDELVREFGLSLKSPEDGLKAIALGFKILQVNFSMIDQRAWECGLLKEAQKKGVKIIARTPFCFGFLTGKIKSLNFHERDHRSGWPKAQLERWLEAAKMFDKLNDGKCRSLSILALKFCLAPKAVSCVIPGIQTPTEALENAAVSYWPDLTPEEIANIQDIYLKNNFYTKTT